MCCSSNKKEKLARFSFFFPFPLPLFSLLCRSASFNASTELTLTLRVKTCFYFLFRRGGGLSRCKGAPKETETSYIFFLPMPPETFFFRPRAPFVIKFVGEPLLRREPGRLLLFLKDSIRLVPAPGRRPYPVPFSRAASSAG